MIGAAKRKSSLLPGLAALRLVLLLIVTLCLGETRVWGFGITSQPASGVFESVTPSSTGENYDGFAYDASDSPVAAKTTAGAADDAFKHGFKYDPRVRARGVQDPVSHNFPHSFDDAVLSTPPIPKNNGYNMFQKPGTMNGKDGVFEIGVTKDGVIDHRFFRPTK